MKHPSVHFVTSYFICWESFIFETSWPRGTNIENTSDKAKNFPYVGKHLFFVFENRTVCFRHLCTKYCMRRFVSVARYIRMNFSYLIFDWSAFLLSKADDLEIQPNTDTLSCPSLKTWIHILGEGQESVVAWRNNSLFRPRSGLWNVMCNSTIWFEIFRICVKNYKCFYPGHGCL